uniref:F-box domain-containing protein n=1 Tax=Hordeum vulgare subsp. vulgare TaxID=112509 RepID=A0A8I6WDQ7_HORVV
MMNGITPKLRRRRGAAPHLDGGIVSEILYRLPTKDAYRLAAVCRRWHAVLSQPMFLSRHLLPRPLPLPSARPYALVVQPRRDDCHRFTHLTLVAFEHTAKDRAPQPCLLDTANDDAVFRLLYSAGADDPAPAIEMTEEAPAVDDAPALPSGEEGVEDYVVFFERTVPMLGVAIVASHGRMLLGRDGVRYYVCDPAANRWLSLPPSTAALAFVTRPGFHYDDANAAGPLAFTVVVLAWRGHECMLVETFRSATGKWETRELITSAAVAVTMSPGAVSPGIHAGASFYWLSLSGGHILRYDISRGRASVVREPPDPDWSKGRAGRSLGSVGGRLRLCAFDIRARNSKHPWDDMEGVLGAWVMEDDDPVPTAPPPWVRIDETVVWNKWMHHTDTTLQHAHGAAVDYAGACGEFVMVEKHRRLNRVDLESGDMVDLAGLQIGNRQLRELYRRFHVFPFFK